MYFYGDWFCLQNTRKLRVFLNNNKCGWCKIRNRHCEKENNLLYTFSYYDHATITNVMFCTCNERFLWLVLRNDVLTNGFIWFSLARSLARILFVPRLRSPCLIEHKTVRVCIRPNFSGSCQRECMRTAKIGPDLRLIFTQVFHACFSCGTCTQYGRFPRMKHTCNATMPVACTVNKVFYVLLLFIWECKASG